MTELATPPKPCIRDARPRWLRMRAPVSVAVLAIVGCGYLYAVDPNQPGHYPVCPTQALLGVDCPGCGMTRGLYALLHGDVGRMIDHNALLPVLIPLTVLLWARWAWRSWSGVRPEVSPDQLQRQTRWSIAALVAVIAFGVVRNFVPYLGSSA